MPRKEEPSGRRSKAEQDRMREAHAQQRAARPTELGRNEAAVVEYLRRHPDATTNDVAFHAIYGGGTVAWEGLHRKTRTNALAEASRVVGRLKSKGVVEQTGNTGGGRARWGITGAAQPADPDQASEGLGSKEGRSGRSRGKAKRSWGIGSAADRGDQPEPKGQGGGGKSYGVMRAADSDDDHDGGDDEGGGAGVFKKSW